MLSVLNLVISGIPSILQGQRKRQHLRYQSFKPCYKWNTFNTAVETVKSALQHVVLNLVISGIPSIHHQDVNTFLFGETF